MGDRLMCAASRTKAWVTRTEPFNRLTARRLRAGGFDPVVEPALRVNPLPANGPMPVPDALVFTSLQGVRHHRFFPSLAHLPVFAVGGHTARFARLCGYRNVASAWGDVHDLRALIRAKLPAGAVVIHLSATQPAGDLVGMLTADGYRASRRCVYETVEVGPADLESLVAQLPEVGAILVHSARAGRHIAAWLERRSPHWSGRVCCISAAVADPFRGFENVGITIAARPNEAALLDLLLSDGGRGAAS
jgi:uroporphyrinogen-III synthase